MQVPEKDLFEFKKQSFSQFKQHAAIRIADEMLNYKFD